MNDRAAPVLPDDPAVYDSGIGQAVYEALDRHRGRRLTPSVTKRIAYEVTRAVFDARQVETEKLERCIGALRSIAECGDDEWWVAEPIDRLGDFLSCLIREVGDHAE